MARKPKIVSPFDIWALIFEQQKMMIAATETIFSRSSLFANGRLSPVEAMAMCVEKPAAYFKGIEKGAMAFIGGKNPAEVMNAAIKPLTAKASSNARRLRR